MDEVTQQNSALVEENAATAKTLEHQAKAMDERVGFFKVGEPAAGASHAERPAPALVAKSAAPKPAKPRVAAPAKRAAAANPVGHMRSNLAAAFSTNTDYKEF